MEDSYVLQLQEPKFREFYLSYSGYAQCGPLHCYGPASRPHYLIHFVVKGKGMYQVSGQKHYLTAGQGFLIEPGTQTFSPSVTNAILKHRSNNTPSGGMSLCNSAHKNRHSGH